MLYQGNTLSYGPLDQPLDLDKRLSTEPSDEIHQNKLTKGSLQ